METVDQKKHGLRGCLVTWIGTLRHFGAERSLLHTEELVIARAVERYGWEAVIAALVGPREQKKTDTFDPGQFLSLRRVLDPLKFDMYLNLGTQWIKKQEKK